MPYINLAGNALGYAGQAMGEVTKVAQRDAAVASRATDTYLRNQRYQDRTTLATLKLQQDQEAANRKAMESVQRGLQQSLNLGKEMGIDTDYAGFQSLDEELFTLDPDMHRQMAEATGMPENDTSAGYPMAYNLRAKAVQNLRAQRSTEAKGAAAQAFAAQQEDAGYSDEVLLGIQVASEDPNVTPAELEVEIAEAQQEAQAQQTQRIAVENGKALAKQIGTQNPGIVSGEGRGAALYASLASGTSKNPRKDSAILRVIANEGEDVMEQIESDGVMLGMTIAQRERAERWGRGFGGIGVGRSEGVDGTTTGAPVNTYSPEGTIDPGKDPEAHRVFRGTAAKADDERAFLQDLDAAGVDLADDAAVDAFRDKWIAERRVSDANAEAAQKYQSGSPTDKARMGAGLR